MATTKQRAQVVPAQRRRWGVLPLIVACALPLLAGLVLRLVLWGNLPRTGLISDEGEYLAAATWLAQGRGFAWYQGFLWTRAPLYPLFVAAHLWLWNSATAVYIAQTALSLLNVGLVFALARQIADCRLHADLPNQQRQPIFLHGNANLVAGLAALLMALYLPFAIYTQVVLSETLFLTLLLGAFLALIRWRRSSSLYVLALGGVLLGLCALTRSLALGFVPLATLWVFFAVRPALVPATRSALLFAATCLLVVAPWTWYNSARLYDGLVVVDTTGAFNLLLGAQTAYDGRRDDAAARDKALALFEADPAQREARLVQLDACMVAGGEPPSLLAQAQLGQADRQQLMTAEALCLLHARPLAFVAKSAGELLDLFRINYSGDERFTDGFANGQLHPAYALGLFLLDDTLYVLVLPLAAIGWGLARGLPGRGLITLWWGYNLAAAPLLFAINRFRLPLLPFAFVLAALAIAWLLAPRTTRPRVPRSALGFALALWLVAATPYAYFEPIAPGQDSHWASYLGYYPSSLYNTVRALGSRPVGLQLEALRAALAQQDFAHTQAILDTNTLSERQARPARVALLVAEGKVEQALGELPASSDNARERVELSVLRGDLLRRLGRMDEARVAFGGSKATDFVDYANPVQWAWDWLRPAPNTRIALGDDNDLGYIAGCYLGEGDTTIEPPAAFRWCSDGARLRFVQAGTGAAQTLVLRVDGRGWPDDMVLTPSTVLIDGREAGSFTLERDGVNDVSIALPPTSVGTDVVITLRSPTFIPDASDYLAQQGVQRGQLRRLGLRIDTAELR